MENPKTGLLILALVATTSLIGGLAGWKLRPPPASVAGPSGGAVLLEVGRDQPVVPGSERELAGKGLPSTEEAMAGLKAPLRDPSGSGGIGPH